MDHAIKLARKELVYRRMQSDLEALEPSQLPPIYPDAPSHEDTNHFDIPKDRPQWSTFRNNQSLLEVYDV